VSDKTKEEKARREEAEAIEKSIITTRIDS